MRPLQRFRADPSGLFRPAVAEERDAGHTRVTAPRHGSA
ncbi:hypothetical protein SFR_4030 [Streptomyces sp. FR-008]|nr:hypothetical protein SFR_4030 [Streptomyces sp. FR-008]